MQLYPRVSIDDSRRVRELSHTLQLELMNSARKRMEKYIPRVVGAWLAGTFDRDRPVSRAASDGLASFLKTEERTAQFWRKCQVQILGYASEAIRETPDSLSDERSTTKEDAEAKYYRVVGGSLCLVLNLLQKGDVEKNRDQFEQFLAADATWALVAARDPFVRRAVYQLVQVCLQHHPDLLSPHLPRVGRALVSDSLKSSQTRSAADLVKVLTNLTKTHPEVWGTKKPPLSRIQSLAEKGSQGDSSAFWTEFYQLIAVVPQETATLEAASDFMKAMRLGISHREEPRDCLPYSWTCYVDTLQRLVCLIPSEDARTNFVENNFHPLIEHYLFPSADKSPWNSGGQLAILTKACTILASHSDETVRQAVTAEWQKLGEKLVSRMANSLPEVSKDYQKSQQSIADEGDRWFALAGALLKHFGDRKGQNGSSSPVASTIISASRTILQSALELLTKRNFKPFAAALTFQSALTKSPDLFRGSNDDIFLNLFRPDQPAVLETLLRSPSAPALLSSVALIGSIPEQQSQFEMIWRACVQSLILSDSSNSIDGITLLISAVAAQPLARKDSSLQDFLKVKCVQSAEGDIEAWKLFETALAFRVIEESNMKSLATSIIQLLGKPQQPQKPVLRALEIIIHTSPTLLSHTSDLHVEIVEKLLSLTEISSRDLSDRAASLRNLLDNKVEAQVPLVGIIQGQLDGAGIDSLE